MEARVGTLAVGARFDTLLTGRRGVVLAQQIWSDGNVTVRLGERMQGLHPDVLVRVVEAVH